MSSSSPPKVILTEHLDEAAASWLAQRTNLLRIGHEDEPTLRRELADADGLVVRTYTRVNEKLLAAAPRLKVVGRAGVGLDNIDLPACKGRGVTVVSTPDANTQAVVEYVTALILDAKRPRQYLAGYVTPQAFHKIRAECVGPQLAEMTLGILGMGRIGRRIAQVAIAIGMRVIYSDLLTPEALALPPGLAATAVNKHTLYRESDILTVHVDGRPENRNLIDAAALKLFNPALMLINTSRGFVIDPRTLAAWAREVEQRGGTAVLDVHEPEPMPESYPLFGISNVKLLPHLASRTHRAMANMSWVVRDVVRVLGGEKPEFPAF